MSTDTPRLDRTDDEDSLREALEALVESYDDDIVGDLARARLQSLESTEETNS